MVAFKLLALPVLASSNVFQIMKTMEAVNMCLCSRKTSRIVVQSGALKPHKIREEEKKKITYKAAFRIVELIISSGHSSFERQLFNINVSVIDNKLQLSIYIFPEGCIQSYDIQIDFKQPSSEKGPTAQKCQIGGHETYVSNNGNFCYDVFCDNHLKVLEFVFKTAKKQFAVGTPKSDLSFISSGTSSTYKQLSSSVLEILNDVSFLTMCNLTREEIEFMLNAVSFKSLEIRAGADTDVPPLEYFLKRTCECLSLQNFTCTVKDVNEILRKWTKGFEMSIKRLEVQFNETPDFEQVLANVKDDGATIKELSNDHMDAKFEIRRNDGKIARIGPLFFQTSVGIIFD